MLWTFWIHPLHTSNFPSGSHFHLLLCFLHLSGQHLGQGYFKAIVSTLTCVCKTCSRILLPDEERRAALAFMKKVPYSVGRRVPALRLQRPEGVRA